MSSVESTLLWQQSSSNYDYLLDFTVSCHYISSDSPEIQPKFVKGSKRYGRRSTPEFIESISDLSEVRNPNPVDEKDLEDNYDSAVPRKREVKG